MVKVEEGSRFLDAGLAARPKRRARLRTADGADTAARAPGGRGRGRRAVAADGAPGPRLAAYVARSPGTSLGSRRPWRRQPTRRSQVEARATGAGERASATIPSRQPWNHGPEDAGSIRPTRGARAPRCLRALLST